MNLGNIQGSTKASASIMCGDIYGNVEAEEITCKSITCEHIKTNKINIKK